MGRRASRFVARLITASAITALGLTLAAPAAEVPSSPFIAIVYRYADTMLQHGRDTHGPIKTGLFLSALDREELKPLIARPAPPAGIRRGDRDGEP